MGIIKLCQSIKYRKQLKAGYGLLSDLGAKKKFLILQDKAVILNGVDPLVAVDLKTAIAKSYKSSGEYKVTYGYSTRGKKDNA